MTYEGDYKEVKERCKTKIESLSEELEKVLRGMGYQTGYVKQATALFEAEIDDLLGGVLDQIEAEIIGGCGGNITDLANSALYVAGPNNAHRHTYYCGVNSRTQNREIGKEQKISLYKEDSPKES